MKFSKIFNETKKNSKLDKKNNLGIAGHLCKAAEELGELAQSINKLIGRKKIKENESKEQIKDNILEESADLIQCVIAILSSKELDFTAEQLKQKLFDKNLDYKEFINSKNLKN